MTDKEIEKDEFNTYTVVSRRAMQDLPKCFLKGLTDDKDKDPLHWKVLMTTENWILVCLNTYVQERNKIDTARITNLPMDMEVFKLDIAEKINDHFSTHIPIGIAREYFDTHLRLSRICAITEEQMDSDDTDLDETTKHNSFEQYFKDYYEFTHGRKDGFVMYILCKFNLFSLCVKIAMGDAVTPEMRGSHISPPGSKYREVFIGFGDFIHRL